MVFRKYLIFLSLLIPAMFGCSGSKSLVTFEVLEPAEYTYPENVQAVGYLNRSPVSKDNFSAVNNSNNKEVARINLTFLDTTFNNNLYKGFRDAIDTASDLQSYLQSMRYIESRPTDTLGQTKPVDPDLKFDMMYGYDLDALIIQDYYKISIGNTTYYSGSQKKGEYVVYGTIKWSLYFGSEDKPAETYVLRKALYYPYSEDNKNSLKLWDILSDWSADAGYAYGLKHIPQWIPLTRMLFGGRDERFEKALTLTGSGDWDKAVEIWKSLVKEDKTRVVARAWYNLGVFYEMTDDLDEAISCLEKAVSASRNYNTEGYLEDLKVRKKKAELIYKQVR